MSLIYTLKTKIDSLVSQSIKELFSALELLEKELIQKQQQVDNCYKVINDSHKIILDLDETISTKKKEYIYFNTLLKEKDLVEINTNTAKIKYDKLISDSENKLTELNKKIIERQNFYNIEASKILPKINELNDREARVTQKEKDLEIVENRFRKLAKAYGITFKI